MKIIHTADIHLDSALTEHFDKVKARERRTEILLTFRKMVEYAVQEHVSAVLIAGDLFDTRNVSSAARAAVRDIFDKAPSVGFYYLRGNHDTEDVWKGQEKLPDNVHLFTDTWTTWVLNPGHTGRKITVTGAELNRKNGDLLPRTLSVNPRDFNIVMLHGGISSAVAKRDAEEINLKDYRNRGIDYLALGHFHQYQLQDLDSRGKYCYPGCLEGRGFDECGEHGFMLLDVEEDTGACSCQFIPFSKRRLYVISTDISGVKSTAEAEEKIRESLKKESVSERSLVRILLTGELDLDTELDLVYLKELFSGEYYEFQIRNETTCRVDYQSYRHDMSLRGEFVRTVEGDRELTTEDAAEIIRMGLDALSGKGDFE